MKKFSTLFLLSLLVIAKLGAQENHLIIFSEDLLPFYAYVNGVKQNSEAQANVKVTGLDQQSYKLKVVHVDETIPTLDKNLYFEPMGMTSTIKIKNTKKGYKLRFFDQTPLKESSEGDFVIPYHETEEVIVETTTMGVDTDMNHTIESSGTHTTTSENVNMNVNIGGVSMGVDVNITETTSESIDINQNMVYEEEVVIEDYEVPSQTGPCISYMGPVDFDNAKESIASKSFSDSKMTLAKQITKSNCLSADQVREIMLEFSFEDDKLEYAKYAYEFCYDQSNYYKVNDAFEFEMTIEELNEFIK